MAYWIFASLETDHQRSNLLSTFYAATLNCIDYVCKIRAGWRVKTQTQILKIDERSE